MKPSEINSYRGKRLVVRMKDGTKFTDVFLDRTRAMLIFNFHRVGIDAVKSVSRLREIDYRWLTPYDHFVDADFIKEFPNQCPVTKMAGFTIGDAPRQPCSQMLSANGECPEHGKVRLNPREKFDRNGDNQPRLYLYQNPKQKGKIKPRTRRYDRVGA